MSLPVAAPSRLFRQLRHYDGAETELVNWSHRFLRSATGWEQRLRETLSDLLESPDRKQLIVTTRHWMDRERPVTQTALNTDTFIVGRAEECHLVLPESTINREHARLLRRGDGFFLEDLGSRLGTFIGDRKLTPHEPTPLAPGVTFTVFPYSIEIGNRIVWRREERFGAQAVRTHVTTWQEARTEQSSDAIAVELRFPPAEGPACFAITGRLLDELLRGLMGKDHLAAAGMLGTDAGCMDYVLAALSERLREELRWPFVAEFGSWHHPPRIANDTRGLAVAAQVSIRDAHGTVRLFLPVPLLQTMRAQSPPATAVASFGEVTWPCALLLSEVALSASDLRGIALGDTVLLTPRPKLLLPGARSTWNCTTLDSNFRRFQLHNSAERVPQVEATSQPTSNTDPLAPELQDLPVLLQVILGEKQFTLSELQRFAEGTLINLERGETEPVRLAVNGKVLGSGELVRIEEHLGVRVLGWNQ